MIIFQLAEAVVDLKGFGFFFCVQYFCLNSFQILSVVMWSARRQLAQILLNQKEVAVIFVVCSPIFLFKPSIEYNKPIWNVLQSFQKVCVWKSGGILRRLLQCHFAWLHGVFNFCILWGTLLKIKTGKDFHLDQYRSLLMNITHEVQVDLFPLFAWLHQKDGIMFTVGNVDHYIDRYIGRRSGWQSINTRSTLGRLSIDSRPTGDRVSIEYRLTVDHYVDRYSGGHYLQ